MFQMIKMRLYSTALNKKHNPMFWICYVHVWKPRAAHNFEESSGLNERAPNRKRAKRNSVKRGLTVQSKDKLIAVNLVANLVHLNAYKKLLKI